MIITTSLEISKQLKEKGFPQRIGDKQFYWILPEFRDKDAGIRYEKRRLMTNAADQDLAPALSLDFIASSIAVRYSKSSALAFNANLYSLCAAANSAFDGFTSTGMMTGFEGADRNCCVIPARSAKSTSTTSTRPDFKASSNPEPS